jgi:L-arabinose isomerase
MTNMAEQKTQELWFLTGSQHLYGDETLKQVARNSREIAEGLDRSAKLPAKVVWKPILTGPEAIQEVCLAANSAPECAGVVTWMHTFSPAKMWIAGLTRLQKPLAHLHTQYNVELPWGEIDMDFMNLNQSAHGDREYGFIGARLRLNRKIVVGHWQDPEVVDELAGWARATLAMAESRRLKIARFGGMNMREVAVTGGDRVEAQIQLGWSVNGYGVGDLAARIAEVSDAEVDRLLAEYEESYVLAAPLQRGGEKRENLRYAARQEIAIRAFLEAGGFGAYTTTFEDLHGMKQLPGLASQRLMADGYGFGAEGDWKTAALVRLGKVMTSARTCSRSARPSPTASRRSRFTRSTSAVRQIRPGSCSTPDPARP